MIIYKSFIIAVVFCRLSYLWSAKCAHMPYNGWNNVQALTVWYKRITKSTRNTTLCSAGCNTLRHTATHCNTLQHTIIFNLQQVSSFVSISLAASLSIHPSYLWESARSLYHCVCVCMSVCLSGSISTSLSLSLSSLCPSVSPSDRLCVVCMYDGWCVHISHLWL